MTDAATPTARAIAWPVLIRQLHLWIGMLIAPSVLIFAFSGALQIFRLHEHHPGYAPPSIIEKLGRLHRDQVFAVAAERPARAAPAAEAHEHEHEDGAEAHDHEAAPAATAGTPRPGPTLSRRLLQWFFTLVAAGLFVSTLLGVWMGVAISRWKVSARWWLAAGVLAPVVLILIPG